jgi:Protein of unknown function (DUF4239)
VAALAPTSFLWKNRISNAPRAGAVTFLHDLPSWLFATLTIAVFVGAALTGLVVTRRWVRKRGLHALVDNGVVGWIFSAILVIYAIAIGLIAVATWGNASRASNEASDEASRIAALYRDFTGYPDPVRTELRARLVRYTRFIIDEEWPAQRLGLIPHRGSDVLTEIERVLYVFEPTTEGQRILHAEALRAFNELIEERRERLEAVEYAVPGTLWAVVLVGAAFALVGSYVFSMESLVLHGLMTGLLAAMIGLLVFFIATTDRPYRGTAGVSPLAYELILHDAMQYGSSR